MKLLGNIIWLVFGGFATAMGYFWGSLAMAVTIIGIPFAIQSFKLGILCLWPFGQEIQPANGSSGALSFVFNIIWIILAGFWIALTHLFFGILLAITIIGLPWAQQHFKLAGLALAPFGKEILVKV